MAKTCSGCGQPDAVLEVAEFPSEPFVVKRPLGPSYCESCYAHLHHGFCERHASCGEGGLNGADFRPDIGELWCTGCEATLLTGRQFERHVFKVGSDFRVVIKDWEGDE
jgi:hypothetical protein